jgi:hypothetical protein
MTTTQNILLIILTISYATLLVLSIIAVSLAIKILKSIRNISAKVESGVEDISSTIDAVGDKLKPVLTAGVVKFVMRLIKNRK